MSGKESEGYKSVLANINTISSHLRANDAAKEALITKYHEHSWLELTATPDEKGLVKLVLDRIFNDDSQYDIFIGMLRDIAGTDLIVKKLTVERSEGERRKKVEGKNKGNRDVESFKKGPPNKSDKYHTLKELQEEFKKIKNATRDGVMQKCGNETRDLVDKIMDLPAPLRDDYDESFLDKHADSIEESQSTRTVFHRIGLHWDYLNPDIYDHLITTYSLNDLIEPLKEYRVKLDTFSEQISLQEFCVMDGRKGSSVPPPGFVEQQTKHNWNPTTTPLKEAINFQKNSASKYGVRECAVWLANIGEGCVSITLLVPKDALQVIKNTTPQFFQTYNILHVELEGKCLYQVSAGVTPIENMAMQSKLGASKLGDLDTASAYEQTIPKRKKPGHPYTAVHIAQWGDKALSPGDHILYEVDGASFQSGLVKSAGNGKVCYYTNSKDHGIHETVQDIADLENLHIVCYTEQCRFTNEEALQRAQRRLDWKEQRYSPLFNNSHFFVSHCKTGCEYPLTDIIIGISHYNESNNALDPVPIKKKFSIQHIKRGDHVFCGADRHCLVLRTCIRDGTITVLTCEKNKIVEKTYFVEREAISQIEYECSGINENPEEKIGEEYKNRSDGFVTKMRLGKEYFFDNRCMFTADCKAVSCTRVSPDISIDEGDHIIVPFEGDYCSLLIYAYLEESKVVSMPNLRSDNEMYGVIDLSEYENIYRVNYNECLPSKETRLRACSKIGEQKCRELSSVKFVSWVKTNREMDIDFTDLLGNEVIEEVCPVERQKILSFDEIEIGDHIIKRNKHVEWLHYLVAGKNDHTMTVISCHNTFISEEEVEVNPEHESIYRIIYPESLSSELAIKRARSQVGKHNFRPLARLWFVRWAKTGSDQGIEVQFLTNTAMPVLKSKIRSFSQLDPGDYLVKVASALRLNEHYLVTEVLSPTECLVIGSRGTRVCDETLIEFEDDDTYIRLSYNDETACIDPDLAIKKAREATGKYVHSVVSAYARKSFVNYVLTGEDTDVDIDSLVDDRLLLRRQTIESTSELKDGDHIERPFKHIESVGYHHMFVVNSKPKGDSDEIVRVIHFSNFNVVKESDENVFETGKLNRIIYPERYSLDDGYQILREIMNSKKGKQYSLRKNNCEHVVTEALTGHYINLQIQKALRKALEFGVHHISKPLGVALGVAVVCQPIHVCFQHGHLMGADLKAAPLKLAAKCGAKAEAKAGGKAMAKVAFGTGFHAAASASTVGLVAGVAVGANLLFEGPIFAHSIYQLKRKKTFKMISEHKVEAGAIIGQVAIPVPIVGVAVGGMVGSVSGQMAGRAEGALVSKLASEEDINTLPEIVEKSFVFICVLEKL